MWQHSCRYLRAIGSLLLWATFNLSSMTVGAREILLEHSTLTTRVGDSGASVIFQDNTGAMWFITQNGLVRFDGKRSTEFPQDNNMTGALREGPLVDLLSTSDQRLWVLAGGRLQVFNDATESWLQVPYIPSDVELTGMSSVDGRRVWMTTTSGLALFQPLTGQFRQLQTQDVGGNPLPRLTSVTALTSSELIGISPEDELIALKVRSDNLVEKQEVSWGLPSDARINSLEYDHFRHQLVLVTREHGIYTRDLKTEEVKQALSPSELGTKLSTIYNMYIEEDRIWLATQTGLYYVETDWKLQQPAMYGVDNPDNLTVFSISRSTDGIYWVSTFSEGLLLGTEYYAKIVNDSNSGLTSSVVMDMVPLEDRRVLLGTKNEIAVVDLASRGVIEQFPLSDLADEDDTGGVTALAVDGRDWLVGTLAGGLYRIAVEEHKVFKYPVGEAKNMLPASGVVEILRHSSGAFVVLTWKGGVSIIRGEQVITLDYPTDGVPIVTSALELDSGDVLLATTPGFFMLDKSLEEMSVVPTYLRNSAGESNPLASHTMIWAMAEHEGTIFATIDNLGLTTIQLTPNSALLDAIRPPEVSNFYAFAQSQDKGLLTASEDSLYSISKDQEEGYRVDRIPLQRWSDTVAPLINSSDGSVLVGTGRGLLIFDQINGDDGESRYLFGISHVSIDGRGLSNATLREEGIEIPSDTRATELRFFLASFRDPANTEYAYRIVGYFDDWHYLGNEASVSLTRLPAGEYLLELAAKPADGAWIRPAQTIPISVQPSIWLTWQMVVFYGVLVGLVALAVVWWIKINQAVLHNRNSDLVLALQKQARETESARIEGMKAREKLQALERLYEQSLAAGLTEAGLAIQNALATSERSGRIRMLTEVAESLADLHLSLEQSAVQSYAHPKHNIYESPQSPASLPTDVLSLLDTIASQFHSDFLKTGARHLYVLVDPDIPQNLSLPEEALRSIIQAMLLSIVKNIPITGDISLTCTKAGGELVLIVSESTSTAGDHSVSATGLKSVERLAKGLGGTLSHHRPESGLGATLKVILPLSFEASPLFFEEEAAILSCNPNESKVLANHLARLGFRSERISIEDIYQLDDETPLIVGRDQMDSLMKLSIYDQLLRRESVAVVVGDEIDIGSAWHQISEPISFAEIETFVDSI